MKVPMPDVERFRVQLRLTRPVDFPFEHGGVCLTRALVRHGLPPRLIRGRRRLTGVDPGRCPVCGRGRLHRDRELPKELPASAPASAPR